MATLPELSLRRQLPEPFQVRGDVRVIYPPTPIFTPPQRERAQLSDDEEKGAHRVAVENLYTELVLNDHESELLDALLAFVPGPSARRNFALLTEAKNRQWTINDLLTAIVEPSSQSNILQKFPGIQENYHLLQALRCLARHKCQDTRLIWEQVIWLHDRSRSEKVLRFLLSDRQVSEEKEETLLAAISTLRNISLLGDAIAHLQLRTFSGLKGILNIVIRDGEKKTLHGVYAWLPERDRTYLQYFAKPKVITALEQLARLRDEALYLLLNLLKKSPSR